MFSRGPIRSVMDRSQIFSEEPWFSALEANARNLISHLFDDNDFGLAALPALVILQ